MILGRRVKSKTRIKKLLFVRSDVIFKNTLQSASILLRDPIFLSWSGFDCFFKAYSRAFDNQHNEDSK